ncbi:uncharacterized protein BXZ73DRAFT_101957 [Epithele typhae]|uniref:uncharacterized protein n=1 Tax=Epithele typhae TaxID=378194 RepID=UPI002007EA83|nr:uncharacterized protein BXZ73DRAFT_101957 [Epithele typhae]KAH9929894.1 hypothetical protein BXZ73DRAFT_101957 [Epithele typhae]
MGCEHGVVIVSPDCRKFALLLLWIARRRCPSRLVSQVAKEFQEHDKHCRPRTSEPTGMGMTEDDEEQELNSFWPSTITLRPTSPSPLLEMALELSSSLEAQHATAQSTISVLESKVTSLENLVQDTQTQVQSQVEVTKQRVQASAEDEWESRMHATEETVSTAAMKVENGLASLDFPAAPAAKSISFSPTDDGADNLVSLCHKQPITIPQSTAATIAMHPAALCSASTTVQANDGHYIVVCRLLLDPVTLFASPCALPFASALSRPSASLSSTSASSVSASPTSAHAAMLFLRVLRFRIALLLPAPASPSSALKPSTSLTSASPTTASVTPLRVPTASPSFASTSPTSTSLASAPPSYAPPTSTRVVLRPPPPSLCRPTTM